MSALVGSACGSTPAPVAAPSAPAPALTLAWTNPALRPIAQPKAVGGTIVGIVSTPDRGLRIVGLDPATGQERWADPITPGGGATGVLVHFEALEGGRVGYLRAIDKLPYWGELVVADARDGRVIGSTDRARYTSYWACNDRVDLCATTYHPTTWHRLDVTGHRLVSGDERFDRLRSIGAGLLDLGDRPGNTVSYLRHDRMYWRMPLGAAFPPGFSSDHGWAWNLFPDQHVLVGSVYGASVQDGAIAVRNMAALTATAGISEITGEALWTDRGSSLHCRLGEITHPVRCRTRGIITLQDGADPVFDDHLDVAIEGFDVTTGKTTWSVPLGASRQLNYTPHRPAIAGTSRVLLEAPRGPIVLDYATGNVEPARPGATYWCLTRAKYELARPDGTPDERSGDHLASICDARGRPATALPSVEATAAAGARVDDMIVIATADGYAGYRVVE